MKNPRTTALDGLASLPPFSPILTRVLADLTAEDVSFSHLGELIEKDTVLSGNILSIVNSALYARRSTIVSIRHAIAMLGINKVRNAVLALSISRMWTKRPFPQSWSTVRFNQHSAATAILSDLIAQRTACEFPEGAFAGGLLHDVGHMLIAFTMPRTHDEILHMRHSTGRLGVECERELLGFTHADLSGDALRHWKLPPVLVTAVRDHHAPRPSEGKLIELSRIIQAANNYINSTDLTVWPNTSADSADATLLEQFLPQPEIRARVIADFNAEHELLLQFFR